MNVNLCLLIDVPSIFQMIQATFTLEDMIKTEYLRNDWWYWSSFSAAAKSSTLPSLALRIYSLDLAIIYEKMPNSSFTDSSEPSVIAEPKPLMNVDTEKSKASRKSTRKRKESDSWSHTYTLGSENLIADWFYVVWCDHPLVWLGHGAATAGVSCMLVHIGKTDLLTQMLVFG